MGKKDAVTKEYMSVLGQTDEFIVSKIVEKFQVTEAEAKQYMDK